MNLAALIEEAEAGRDGEEAGVLLATLLKEEDQSWSSSLD